MNFSAKYENSPDMGGAQQKLANFLLHDEVSLPLWTVPSRRAWSGRPDENSSRMSARSNNFLSDAERDVVRDAAHGSQALRSPHLPAARLADHYDLGAELHLCTHSDSATPEFHYQGGATKKMRMRDGHERFECRPAAASCAVCDRKFGLIRYYSWRATLCSKKCLDRVKARRERDRRWLFRFEAVGYAAAPQRRPQAGSRAARSIWSCKICSTARLVSRR